MRVTCLLYGEVLAPVVAAQTLPLLRGLRDRGHETSVLAVVSPRYLLSRRSWRGAVQRLEAAVTGRLVVRVHGPRHSFAGGTARRVASAVRQLSPDVVHARQARAAWHALQSGETPVLADLRGLRAEEFLLETGRSEEHLTSPQARILARHRAEQADALTGSAGIVCVSERFRERLGGGASVRVIPNATEPLAPPSPEVREAHRSRLGIAPCETAVVYSGSLAPWQCVREAVALFRGMSRLREDLRLVLLTHDEEGGRKLAAEAGVADAVVRRLAPEETRRTLPAFDLALLLRERSVVNEVACPVKFAEYLAAGLPVVITEGIGDASGWTADHGLGIVLSDLSDPGNAELVVEALPGLNPGAGREFVRERLSFDRTVPRYEEALQAAAGGGD